MWICARCGTEAQRPETCSGCGSPMKPFDQPPKEDRYQFVLYTKHQGRAAPSGFYGPFPSVTAADQWWEANCEGNPDYSHHDYEVVLMENPNDRGT